MRLPERIAKAVVEIVLPGARMEFRTHQAHGEYDFDLWHSASVPAAVEVTTSADSRYVETLAVLSDDSRGGSFVEARRCKNGWFVHLKEGAHINRIRDRIDDYLRAIEDEGLTEFFVPTDSHTHVSVARIGTELRIEGGRVMAWKNGRAIGIASPARFNWVDPNYIAVAVSDEASKADNVSKLGRAKCEQRHLFVFVDSSNHAAWGPLVKGMMPSAIPTLPDAITRAWVASSGGALNRCRVMFYDRAEGWRDFGFVTAQVTPDD